jgi:predicted RNA binding protein YcfA (HicA-like mRNA interferase family)
MLRRRTAQPSLYETATPPGQTMAATEPAISCRSSATDWSSGRGRTVLDVAEKYKAVRQALSDAGWSVARQHGSHEVWAHPEREDRIVVAGKDSDTVPVGTLGSIGRASGLEHLR